MDHKIDRTSKTCGRMYRNRFIIHLIFPPSAGEVLYLPMDEILSPDTLLGDVNATLYNSPRVTDGKRGKAISLNGVDEWADFGLHS